MFLGHKTIAGLCTSGLIAGMSACTAAGPVDGVEPTGDADPYALPVAPAEMPDPTPETSIDVDIHELAAIELDAATKITFNEVAGEVFIGQGFAKGFAPPLDALESQGDLTALEMFKALAPERDVPELLLESHVREAEALERLDPHSIRDVVFDRDRLVQKSAYNFCSAESLNSFDPYPSWKLKTARDRDIYFIRTNWRYWIKARYYEYPYLYYRAEVYHKVKVGACRDDVGGDWFFRLAYKTCLNYSAGNVCTQWPADWFRTPPYELFGENFVWSNVPGASHQVQWEVNARGGNPNTGASFISVLTPENQ